MPIVVLPCLSPGREGAPKANQALLLDGKRDLKNSVHLLETVTMRPFSFRSGATASMTLLTPQ